MFSRTFFDTVTLTQQEHDFLNSVDQNLNELCGQTGYALLFPSLHKRFRFLIHKLAENFPELSTFSIGEGWDRRTVVCFIEDLKTTQAEERPSYIYKRRNRAKHFNMDNICDCQNSSDQSNNQPIVSKPRRSRRPDMQVYVPRARRTGIKVSSPKGDEPEADKLAANGQVDPISTDVHCKICLSKRKKNLVSPDIDIKDSESGIDDGSITEELDSSILINNNVRQTDKSAKELDTNEKLSTSLCIQNDTLVVVPQINADESQTVQINSLVPPTSEIREETEVIALYESAEASEVTMDYVDPKPTSKGNESDGEDGEDSWDSFFDDSGECLDPDVMKDLDKKLKKVKIIKPAIDYLKFTPEITAEIDLSSEEFTHIVELYDFPTEFKTQDLILAFSQLKNFDIKWVDDTHALAVFASTQAASTALSAKHVVIKSRPLSEAIQKSKQKAKHCSEFLLPYKKRPETSASLARRLVTGALGIKPNISPDKRAEERKKLQEAKDKKKVTAKQKKAIWDGTV